MRQLLLFIAAVFLFSCQPYEKAVPVKIYSDIDSALAVAQQTHRPILAFYSGYAVVNCRKIEDRLFTRPKASRALNDFVVLELMTDARKELPDSLQGNYLGKDCRTFGQWYLAMEMAHGKNASQPFFLFYNAKGQLLSVEGKGYMQTEDQLLDFLLMGKAAGVESGDHVLSALPRPSKTSGPPGSLEFPVEDTAQAEINAWDSKDGALHWKVSAKKLGEHKAQVTFETDLPKGYLLYALNQPDTNAPSSELLLNNVLPAELPTLPEQPGTLTGFDKMLDCRNVYFENHVKMTQVIDYDGRFPYFISGVLQVYYSDRQSIRIDSFQFRVRIR